MKRIILAGMFFLIYTSFLSLYAQWAKTYGGSESDAARSIQQTIDGGYIVAGSTSSFGAGESDIWILKLSSDGDIEWQKTYGGSNDDGYATCIQQTSDGGYIIAGNTFSFGDEIEIWVFKLTSAGDIEWQKTYGGGEANSIQQTSDGGYIVAGKASGDICIFKLTSAGDIEWQKIYGGGEANSIQQTIDGGYIVAGKASGDICIFKLTSAGDIEWQKIYGGGAADSIQQTIDGGYIVTGSYTSYTAYYFFLKLSSTGDIEWQRACVGIRYTSGLSSIQQTSDGGYVVACWTILKLSSAGDIEWQKKPAEKIYHDPYHVFPTYACHIQQTYDGGYIVASTFLPHHQADADFLWISKLLPDGNIDLPCRFIKESDANISVSDISPEDTNIEPEDTDIMPQETDISPQDTNATVLELCTEKPLLSIGNVRPRGGTTDPAPGAYHYDLGTEVQISAIPSENYYFANWVGDVPSDHLYDNSIIITMDSDKFIWASFGSGTPGGGGGDYYDTEWGGGGYDPGCFIATAAYGSLLHPYVRNLRDFRDTYLIPSKLGRKFVELYYKYSPFIANLITKHKALKVSVRINLFPIVIFSYLMVHLGPIVTAVVLIFIFALPVFIVLNFRRKLRQVKAKDSKASASLDRKRTLRELVPPIDGLDK